MADNMRPLSLYQIPVNFSPVRQFLFREEGPSDCSVGPKVLLLDPQAPFVRVPPVEPPSDFEVQPSVKP